MQNIAEQFGNKVTDTTKIQEMAEFIAIEDDAIAQLSADLQERKDNLDQVKSDLASLMIQSGIDSVKLDNGLTPKAKITTKYFKAAGVENREFAEWFIQQGHYPALHWNSYQGFLREFEDKGGQLPDMMNKEDVPTVTMYGKSKFVAQRNQ